jgi:hypothetical protein
VYHSLYEFQTGAYQSTSFSSNIFVEAYEFHMRTLQTIERNKAKKYHKMMADFCTQVMYVLLLNRLTNGSELEPLPGDRAMPWRQMMMPMIL